MARTIQTIYNSMVAEGINQATDANLPDVVAMFNNTSSVAIWKILFYTVAFCINALESIYDLFRTEINNDISLLKPGSAQWYASMATKFQYGYDLVPGTDSYDNSALTSDQIAASQIVNYAAAVELTRGIRAKVATLSNGILAPLSAPQLAAFSAYMEQIKYAGIVLLETSGPPDDLMCTLRVYYDPLVLDANGARLDGTDPTPVQTAFNNYLLGLPFNGLFVPELMLEQLQQVEGVLIVKDDLWQARYGTLDFANIDVEYTPDSGYLTIDPSNLLITFIPHGPI